MGRRSVHSVKAMKQRGERFALVTCYDYPSARLIDEVGIPGVLVGDSLGTTVLGYQSTVPVTLEEIIHHTKPVVRGTERAFVVADLPFGSYQASPDDAIRSATRLMQEGEATAVKLEGGAHIASTATRLVEVGIPVMGHIGLTPQSVNQLGGHRIQGKTAAAAVKLLNDGLALEAAGCFSIVLEGIPAPVAALISERLAIPTIGIGAGPGCDGQIQVWHDMLGLLPDFLPRHTKHYAELAEGARNALASYQREVVDGSFPTLDHAFELDQDALEELRHLTGEATGVTGVGPFDW